MGDPARASGPFPGVARFSVTCRALFKPWSFARAKLRGRHRAVEGTVRCPRCRAVARLRPVGGSSGRSSRDHPSEGRPKGWSWRGSVEGAPIAAGEMARYCRFLPGETVVFRPQGRPECVLPWPSGRCRAIPESSCGTPMYAASLTKGYGGTPPPRAGPYPPHGPARFSLPAPGGPAAAPGPGLRWPSGGSDPGPALEPSLPPSGVIPASIRVGPRADSRAGLRAGARTARAGPRTVPTPDGPSPPPTLKPSAPAGVGFAPGDCHRETGAARGRGVPGRMARTAAGAVPVRSVRRG